jgi:hypothetical protein
MLTGGTIADFVYTEAPLGLPVYPKRDGNSPLRSIRELNIIWVKPVRKTVPGQLEQRETNAIVTIVPSQFSNLAKDPADTLILRFLSVRSLRDHFYTDAGKERRGGVRGRTTSGSVKPTTRFHDSPQVVQQLSDRILDPT